MRVLVACEFSGRVSDAFLENGHDAWSCDLIPSESSSERHILGNALDILDDGWDLMIAHPPCTYLTVAANGWHARRPERQPLREEAAAFFMALYNAPIARVAVENPIGVMSTLFRKPDQIIQPCQFGHPERKATCLWLKGLPVLSPTKMVEPEGPVHIDSTTGKRRYSLDYLPGNAERWKIRSRTFQGIADAMADQWGSLCV